MRFCERATSRFGFFRVLGRFQEAGGGLLGLCLIGRSFLVGIHDGCRIAVVWRNFSEGGGLVNCEVGQEEFVLPFVCSSEAGVIGAGVFFVQRMV